jgi:hypothetical protein
MDTRMHFFVPIDTNGRFSTSIPTCNLNQVKQVLVHVIEKISNT